jgi:hypothetical protein
MIAHLRSGDWVSPARLRMIAILLAVVYAATWTYLLSGRGLFDPLGRPVGSDFAAFYGASRALLRGVPAFTLYDPERFNVEIEPFTGAIQYVWVYPPTAFLAYWPLGLLPYLASLATWIVVGLAAYLAVVRRILPNRAALLGAALSPAVFVTMTHGHNGLLLAALLGGGLVLLPGAPFTAGLLFGCAVVKPHLALLIPVALLAERRWRALGGAAVMATALSAIATQAFGTESWVAFEQSGSLARLMLEAQGVSYAKISSVFAAVRLLGSSLPVAYAVQGLATAGAAWVVYVVWRKPIAYDVKASMLIIAGLLATPYLYDYDLPILVIGLAFWARDALRTGWNPWEKSMLFAAWATPLLMRAIAVITHVGPLPVVLIASIALLVVRVKPVPPE